MGYREKNPKRVKKGFSVVESMLSMFFFLLIVLFSLECFIATKKHFNQLQRSETSNTAAYAALDRMRRDVEEAGMGLKELMTMGVLEGISQDQNELVILSKQEELPVIEDIVSGQQRIAVANTRNIKIGQQICIFNSGNGEMRSVISTTRDSILLDLPFDDEYPQERTKLLILRRLSLFFDESAEIIRRKVNTSPAQPLLEEVASFGYEFSEDSNLVRFHFGLNMEEEKDYETTVFPKNMALSITRQGI